MKKNILILGVSSFVGSNLLEEMREKYRVIGTYFKSVVNIPGVLTLPCDVLKKESLATIMARFKPDVVIYAVGISSLIDSAKNPREAESLNSTGAINSLKASERVDAKFVYISSAYVFSGENQLFKEADTPSSNTVYGASLSSIEFHIQRSSQNYLILRCCSLYGRGYEVNNSNWFEELEGGYLKEAPMEVDDKVVLGFLDVKILARILMLLLDSNIQNRLFNISSSDYMTRFEFSQIYGAIFKQDINFIKKFLAEFPFDKTKNFDPTSTHFRLDVKNIETLIGTAMPTVKESLESSYKSLKN